MPFQESPHGSPPLELHFVNWGGEFKLLYITLNAEAVDENMTVNIVSCVASEHVFGYRKEKFPTLQSHN